MLYCIYCIIKLLVVHSSSFPVVHSRTSCSFQFLNVQQKITNNCLLCGSWADKVWQDTTEKSKDGRTNLHFFPTFPVLKFTHLWPKCPMYTLPVALSTITTLCPLSLREYSVPSTLMEATPHGGVFPGSSQPSLRMFTYSGLPDNQQTSISLDKYIKRHRPYALLDLSVF